MAETIIDLQVNTETLKESMADAFSVAGYQDYLKTIRRFGKSLTDELLVLRLSFGRMKAKQDGTSGNAMLCRWKVLPAQGKINGESRRGNRWY